MTTKKDSIITDQDVNLSGAVPIKPSITDKEIVSALKYVSRMRPEFMLSEMRNYIKGEASLQDIYRAVHPSLMDLGLDIIQVEGDFRIVRAPIGNIELTGPEKEKNEMFFQSPGVSRKLERIVEQYIEKKTGKSWDDPVTLERLRDAVVSQKAGYWKEGKSRKITYEKGYDVLGYLAYQFPVYFVQFQHILYSMAKEGLLKTRMKILDVGTGPGTVPLAITDLYNRLDDHRATVYSVEMFDENIEAYRFIVPQYAATKSRIAIEDPIKADIGKLDMDLIPGNLDLIVFSNILNEVRGMTLEQKADLVKKLSGKLAQDGNIIIIEPADKVNSIGARNLIIALKKMGLGIYSPCSFIWGSGCNPAECWSFERQKDIEPTRLMRKMAECDEPYRYFNTDLKYTYAILRRDKLTKVKYKVPPKAKFAKLSKLEMHTGKRINVVCSLMSADLGDDKYSLYKICDGTCQKQVYAVLPLHSLTTENKLIRETPYGTVLTLENVLVKYNEATDSYNLIVGKGTSVEPVEE
jgi:SAM-dependent methyltransferase